MEELAEALAFITGRIDLEVTDREYTREMEKSLADHRKNYKPAAEELKAEMRAAFGKGHTVVDLFTGERIYL